MASSIAVHFVGVANSQIWHTIQYLDGTFQSFFGNVNEQESNDPGALLDVTGAWGWNQDLHVFAINDPYNGPSPSPLWHTVRNTDGSWWPAFVNLQSVIPQMPSRLLCVASCHDYLFPNSPAVIHVCAGLDSPGGLWYARYNLAEQTWVTETVTTAVTAVGTPERIDIAASDDGTLHIFFSSGSYIKNDIAAWHTSRSPQGQWQPTFDFIPAIYSESDTTIYELSAFRTGPLSNSSPSIRVFGRTDVGALIVANPQINPWNMAFNFQNTTGLVGSVFQDIAVKLLVTKPPAMPMCVVDPDGRLWYADAGADPIAFVPFDDRVKMPANPFTKISIATF